MELFFKKTSKIFLLIAGLFTSIGGIVAFFPKIGLESLFNLEYILNYTIILQHWGIMVLLLGIFILISAFKVEWRNPILLFAIFGKLYIVVLYLININNQFSEGFIVSALIDFVLLVYFILYLLYHRRIYKV